MNSARGAISLPGFAKRDWGMPFVSILCSNISIMMNFLKPLRENSREERPCWRRMDVPSGCHGALARPANDDTLDNLGFAINLEPFSQDSFTFFGKFRRLVQRDAFRAAGLGRVVLPAALVGVPVSLAAIELPSGVEAELHEVLVEEIGEENWIRFRFLAPDIDRTRSGAPAFAELERDFPHLCMTLAIPYLETHALGAERIVISISDRVVEFGLSNPDATQYFEQFRIDGDSCIWEAF